MTSLAGLRHGLDTEERAASRADMDCFLLASASYGKRCAAVTGPSLEGVFSARRAKLYYMARCGHIARQAYGLHTYYMAILPRAAAARATRLAILEARSRDDIIYRNYF